jgi:hypothetical protein
LHIGETVPHQLPPIDDDVFEALQARAQPLVDDVNSVLRRLLGLHPSPPESPRPTVSKPAPKVADTRQAKTARGKNLKKTSSAARAPRGSTLPDTEFEIPVLLALDERGGRAPAAEVADRVGELLAERLGDADRERLSGGDVRWRNRVQFARLRLVQAGDLAKTSPRGTWEITEQGSARLMKDGAK